MYKSFGKEGNRIRIKFINTGSGLTTKDGKEVTGFAIAGTDTQFYRATAMINRNEIIVFSDRVADSTARRGEVKPEYQ